MRGRGAAFLIGRAAGKQRAQEESQQASPKATKAEKLEELGNLHDKGVLTDEEFTQEKKKILNSK